MINLCQAKSKVEGCVRKDGRSLRMDVAEKKFEDGNGKGHQLDLVGKETMAELVVLQG